MTVEERKQAIANATECLRLNGYGTVETIGTVFITNETFNGPELCTVVQDIAGRFGIDVEVIVLNIHMFVGTEHRAKALEQAYGGHALNCGERITGYPRLSWTGPEYCSHGRKELPPLDIEELRLVLFS